MFNIFNIYIYIYYNKFYILINITWDLIFYLFEDI